MNETFLFLCEKHGINGNNLHFNFLISTEKISLKTKDFFFCEDMCAIVLRILHGPSHCCKDLNKQSIQIYPAFANSVDPDQLASKKPADLDLQFAIQYVNFYKQSRSSNLIR